MAQSVTVNQMGNTDRVIIEFPGEYCIVNSSFERKDLKYFSDLMHHSLNPSQNISDDDIEIFTNHL